MKYAEFPNTLSEIDNKNPDEPSKQYQKLQNDLFLFREIDIFSGKLENNIQDTLSVIDTQGKLKST